MPIEQKFFSIKPLYLRCLKALFSQKRKWRLLHCRKGNLMNTHSQLKNLILAALFLALALPLPLLTGQIPEIGSMLCPMHIPALLCGFFCGWPWGLAVGLIAPVFRSLLFGMPPIFPTALCMSLELATYGAVSALLYRMLPQKTVFVYVSLLGAMIAGRLIWGAARFLCTGLNPSAFGLSAFFAGAVTTAIPGIIVQLILVPALVLVLKRQSTISQANTRI